MHNRGITIGKFAPLHKGHELLLETAIQNCGFLTVLLGDATDYPYPYEVRKQWVVEYFKSIGYRENQDYCVVIDPDTSTHAPKDDDGTVTDEGFWTAWLGQNKDVIDEATVVFTSDRYGKEIAKRTGLVWFPVDPDREVFGVSGTAIRNDVFTNFAMISDTAKLAIGVTVALMGAESTGKSTMVKNLAAHYKTTYAPEWGRIICEATPQLTYDDFTNIVDMQQRFIRRAQINGTGLCFTDTEAIVTALFAPIYLGMRHEGAEAQAIAQNIDLYIVLAPTVPMVQDGTRVLDEAARLDFHHALLNKLTELKKPFLVIDAVDFDERTQYAISKIDEFIEHEKGKPYGSRD